MDRNVTYKCQWCGHCASDRPALDKHRWYHHPQNQYERDWAEAVRTGRPMNSFYRDDPYY